MALAERGRGANLRSFSVFPQLRPTQQIHDMITIQFDQGDILLSIPSVVRMATDFR